MDKDFSNIMLYPLPDTMGRFVLRFKKKTIMDMCNRTSNAIKKTKNTDIKEKLIIITDENIRIRSL